ncbi:MAG: glutamate--tRNA ligase family protein, partial [Eggerthella lenta]
MGLYADALNRLDRPHIPCYCTRKESHAGGAPHGTLGPPTPEPAATCPRTPPELEAAGCRPCIRLRHQNYAFEDAVFGPFSMTLKPAAVIALRRSDGVIAYQLAVVADDGLMGITQVVRGEVLLVSTPRQLALFDLLGYPRPAYMHLPLLCDPEGERLAKRHASLTLASLRDAGVSPAAVAGYLGWKAGLIGALAPAHPRNLLPAFDPGRLRFLPERVLVEAD